MLRQALAFAVTLTALVCAADEPPTQFVTPRARPVQAPPAQVDPASAPDDGRAAAQFQTEARWQVAGYNNEEIIYTIVITSHDSRIIRCSTELKGYYFENGEKHSVADRQITTVFPDQQVQVGNWMGMDEKSGATYSTRCRPL